MVPSTIAGQLITSVAMVLAMLVLALPISVVGTNFTQARPHPLLLSTLGRRSSKLAP